MKFWDSSALVPALVREKESPAIRRLLRADPEVLVWALSPAEIVGALWRRQRSGDLRSDRRAAAEARLASMEIAWSAVVDVGPVVYRARRLLALHPLRAADSLQLAAALVACDERPTLLPFVTLDSRLAEAARGEGFSVLPRERTARR
jgi:predicted nucleic acid-binding protein